MLYYEKLKFFSGWTFNIGLKICSLDLMMFIIYFVFKFIFSFISWFSSFSLKNLSYPFKYYIIFSLFLFIRYLIDSAVFLFSCFGGRYSRSIFCFLREFKRTLCLLAWESVLGEWMHFFLSLFFIYSPSTLILFYFSLCSDCTLSNFCTFLSSNNI